MSHYSTYSNKADPDLHPTPHAVSASLMVTSTKESDGTNDSFGHHRMTQVVSRLQEGISEPIGEVLVREPLKHINGHVQLQEGQAQVCFSSAPHSMQTYVHPTIAMYQSSNQQHPHYLCSNRMQNQFQNYAAPIVFLPTANTSLQIYPHLHQHKRHPLITQNNTIITPSSTQEQEQEQRQLKLKQKPSRMHLSNRINFPELLYKILMDAELNQFTDIISWLSHGRAFKVWDTMKFEIIVMPNYFSSSKWKSFRR